MRQGLRAGRAALVLALTAALGACGGGGGGETEAEGAVTAVVSADPGTPSTSTSTSAASSSSGTDAAAGSAEAQPLSTNGGNPSSLLTGLAAGTYVGHWIGYAASTTSVYRFNLGGAMLRFTPESYGKLKATGAQDVIAKVYLNEIQTVRLGVAIAGDLYSDDTIYGQGIGVHFYNAQIAGRYDRLKRRVSLTTYPTGTGQFGVRCKYCDGVFVLPPVIYAQYAPVGTSSPSHFRLSVSGSELAWTAVAGVDHWLVSIFEEDGTWVFDQDTYGAPATLPFASDLPAAQGDLDYGMTEFLDKLLHPSTARKLPLPALTKGRRYVAAVTGFNFGAEAIASASLRFTGP